MLCSRATPQAPKVYFFDTGPVIGDEGIKFENLVACHLLKQVQWQQDTRTRPPVGARLQV